MNSWTATLSFAPGQTARDPHARLKIGNNLYDVTLSHDTDPADKAAVLQLVAKKYPDLKIPPAPQVVLFQVTQ